MAGKLIIRPRPRGIVAGLLDVLYALQAWPAGTPLLHLGAESEYFTPDGHAGSRDPWGYFFQSPATLTDVLLRYAPDLLDGEDGGPPAHSLDLDTAAAALGVSVIDGSGRGPLLLHEEARSALSELLLHHVRVRPAIARKAERALRALADAGGGPVTGLCYPGEGVLTAPAADPLAPALPLLTIDDYLDALPPGIGPVYVVTEDEAALQRARHRLGFRFHAPAPLGREAPGPRRGEHELLICLVLAGCAHLCHGGGDLATAALCFSPHAAHTLVPALQRPDQDRAIALPSAHAARYGRTAASLMPGEEAIPWGDPRDYLAWEVELATDLLCRVDLRYGCDPGREGAAFTVGIEGGARIEGRVRATGAADAPCGWSSIGYLLVPRGRHRVALRAGAGTERGVMNFFALRLLPVGR